MKMFNPEDPFSHNSFYALEEEYPYVKTLSIHVLSYYIQNDGINMQQRLGAMKKVADYIGFNVEVIDQNGSTYFKINDNRWPQFDSLMHEIKSIGRGNFENEVIQIAKIILKYKKLNKKWYQFWK